MGGRLRRVAQYIASADAVDLTALREQLATARASGDAASVAQAMARIGVDVPVQPAAMDRKQMGIWEQRIWALVALILPVIVAVIMQRLDHDDDGGATPEQVEQIYRQLVNVQDNLNPPETAPVTAPRNSSCPCGGGRKYKRCHGAPPTSADHPDNRPSSGHSTK